jgi:hypothetical protein
MRLLCGPISAGEGAGWSREKSTQRALLYFALALKGAGVVSTRNDHDVCCLHQPLDAFSDRAGLQVRPAERRLLDC